MKNKLHQKLLTDTTCDLRFDEISRAIYSVDASIYEVKPLGIALPKNENDLKQICKICIEEQVSIIPRGAATGITGSCLGDGLIVDTSKYLNRILNFDPDSKLVCCEPGVIQDDLNHFLSPHGFRLGPDTSTGNRATIGGMVANHSAGARSLVYGTMIDAVESIDLILSTGEKINFGPLTESQWKEKLSLQNAEGNIYRALEEIRKKYSQEIRKNYPPLPRRASGYALDQLIAPFPLNAAKLIVGSEGTLGIIQTVTLSVVAKPKYSELYIIAFDSMIKAMEAVVPLLKDRPAALEMIDDKILEAGSTSPSLRGKIGWLTKIPPVLLVAEFFEPQSFNNYNQLPGALWTKKMVDHQEMQHVWDIRKAGLGLLLSKKSYSRAIAFIEDLSIPPQNLSAFIQTFLNYLSSKGKQAGIYGHVGPGCLHIRPYMDLRSPEEIKLLKQMMIDVTAIVKQYGGALSGEHGDGLIRSWLEETLFSKEIVQAFEILKKGFDPTGLMNPHKIVNPLPVEKDIRKSPTHEPHTELYFEEGITLAADLCNGNGACRKKEGVMCPSFQVTGDEFDTTRARAVMFRDVIRKEESLSNPDLQKILNLCIQCKGCKTECPSQVDMAKMKSEALFHYQERNGYSLRSSLFAHLDSIQKVYPFRSVYNFFIRSPLRQILSWLGIVGPLPHIAKKRFSEIAINQPPGKPVVLVSDTYTEFFNPEIGISAIKVLNALGYHVTVPEWSCCGRAAISKGFLKHAKTLTSKLANQLIPFAEKGIPIIGLEPSCHFTLLDEFRPLLPKTINLENWVLFDTFLAKHLPLPWDIQGSVALHGHCHQKALVGMQDTLKLLHSFPDLEVMEIPSGCCGMAGSFGHEKEHAAFSKQIGELVLLPFVRKLPKESLVIADGFSCRSQIHEYTDKKPLHLAEWLAKSLKL